MSKPTRILIDVAWFVAIWWMWIAIYESFTKTGLWTIIDRACGGVSTLPGRAAVIGACLLVGWLTVAAIGWLIWRVFIARR